MHPRFSFRWLLDELKETMCRELDFVEEAKNSEKCKEDLEHLKFVYVPNVFGHSPAKEFLQQNLLMGQKYLRRKN